MTPEACRTMIAKILSKSIFHALALKRNLVEERTALENGDTLALNTASDSKQLRINKLEALESRRAEICLACGFDAAPANMNALAAWCDDESLIMNSWNQLIDIIKHCQNLNSTNGAIIHVRYEHMKNALTLLRNGTVQGATYGSGGQDTRSLGTHSLAKV